MMSERSTRSRNRSRPRGSRRLRVTALLVAGVHGPEEVVPVELGLTPGAQRVGGAGRFDLDDLGAHVAEQPARERPGDQRADLDDADAVRERCPGTSVASSREHVREVVAHQPVGHDADRLAQRLALVGSGVVVVGAGDLVHLLVGMSDGLEQPAGVAGRAGVVGAVADHQRRHRDVAAALHAVAVGVVVAPLRQPAAQRAEPRQSDRAHVHHLQDRPDSTCPGCDRWDRRSGPASAGRPWCRARRSRTRHRGARPPSVRPVCP